MKFLLLLLGIIAFLVYSNQPKEKQDYLKKKVINEAEKISSITSKKNKIEYMLKEISCKKLADNDEHYNKCLSESNFDITAKQDDIVEGVITIKNDDGKQKEYFKAELDYIFDDITIKRICIGSSFDNMYITSNPFLALVTITYHEQMNTKLPTRYKKCPY